MSSDIVVVGSLNMDMVVTIDRRPERGETLLGDDFFMSPGGKGANQAYAAGRLGASVSMVGMLGDDLFADKLLDNLNGAGVTTEHIAKVEDMSSGIALITIDADGDNSIIVAPGANQQMTPERAQLMEEVISEAKLILVQLEIPLDSVHEVVEIAHKHGVPVLLDPAPAQSLPEGLLRMVDYIVPNESENSQLTGIQVKDEETAIEAGKKLLEMGVKTAVSKLGAQGVVITEASGSTFVPGYRVNAVDTTAAGDAFAGAFATALVAGKTLLEAAAFANAVGALTVTRHGAQVSMPDLKETELFVEGLSQDKVSK